MPTNNITYGNQFLSLPILPQPEYGASETILGRIYQLLADMMGRHCKVFGVRFDLHYPLDGANYPADNSLVQRFVDSFSTYLERRRIDHRLLWVREQAPDSPRHHYHFLLLMDGNLTMSFHGQHLEQAQALWGLALGSATGVGSVSTAGLVHLCTWDSEASQGKAWALNGGVMMQREQDASAPDWDPWREVRGNQACRTLFDRASYLAKGLPGTAPRGVRRFGSSRVSPDLPFPSSGTGF